MFIFISKITLLCLAAALLPKRAPPTAMINFCLRERGISLSYTRIHSTKRISGGASPNGGKACEGGEKGEKEGRAGDSAQSLSKSTASVELGCRLNAWRQALTTQHSSGNL